jgi:hypothetical protein
MRWLEILTVLNAFAGRDCSDTVESIMLELEILMLM